MKYRTCQISFAATGTVRQVVQIMKKGLTPKKLVEMLKAGKAYTTVEEGGTVDVIATGKAVARIESVKNELDYCEFELDRKD
jgi:hypothetical protein